MKVLDLFSGIGGFSLGLERTGGFQTVAFCEIEPFARRVLAKHWPGVFIHDDVRTLNKDTLCRGYAENALLNQLCRETGGSSASVRDAITNIRKHAERRTHLATTSEPLSAEEALSTIMAGNVPAAENANTHFWPSITDLITDVRNVPNTRALYGSLLSGEDFLTTIKFCVTTATWRNPSTVPARIKQTMKVDRYDGIADGISVDVICGGFPCQDISSAGARAGLAGERSGLWADYARLIGELRPRFVLVENVADLRHRGLGDVLGDLAALGYDAEWHCIQAADVGAPHIRDRLWIVAHPDSEREQQSEGRFGREWGRPSNGSRTVAYASSFGRLFDGRLEFAASGRQAGRIHQWSAEPALGRMADGIPHRMGQIAALGNAVVPQIPELIGRAILAAEATRQKMQAA